MSDIYRNKMLFIAPDDIIKELVNGELQSDRIQELLRTESFYGGYKPLLELSTSNYSTIDPLLVSHKILSVNWDGMTLLADIEVVNNELLWSIADNMLGDDIGWFSPRLIISKEPVSHKIDKLALITFDHDIPPAHMKIDENYFKEKCTKIFYKY